MIESHFVLKKLYVVLPKKKKIAKFYTVLPWPQNVVVTNVHDGNRAEYLPRCVLRKKPDCPDRTFCKYYI